MPDRADITPERAAGSALDGTPYTGLGSGLGAGPGKTKPRIHLLITDLDNTLYDWVTFFSAAFYDMVRVAAVILELTEERLLDDLRDVHRGLGDSEHRYALLETRAVRERFAGVSQRERLQRLAPAFQQFDETRQQTLRLYDGVADALARISALGVPVVGYTEATASNAWFRLSRLQISRYIARLYAAASPDIAGADARIHAAGQPDSGDLDDRAGSDAGIPVVPPGTVVHLRPGERKPDPRVLLDICRDTGILPHNALYVGDSLVRDVSMARDAGVWSAWAEYGTRYDLSCWQQLLRISHWTEEDIVRAQETEQRCSSAEPDVILNQGFQQIFDYFGF